MNKKCFNKGLVVAVILLFIGMSVIPSTAIMVEKRSTMPTNGDTLYVGGDGSGNYTRIQDAIDNAGDGSIVFVYNGTYYENIIVNNSITLIGEDKDTTIIDGVNGGHGDHVVSLKKSFIRIKGFSIINGEQSWTRGIELEGHTLMNISISDCIVRDNGGGICFYGVYASNCSITNCIIYNNTMYSIDFNLILMDQLFKNILNILIDNCEIYNNGVYNNGASGISICGEKARHSDIQISNCNIYDNIGNGIMMDPSDNISIHNNSIYGNSGYGIILWKARNVDIHYNNISENTVGGIGLYNHPDPCWNINIYQNTISNNGDGEQYHSGIYLHYCPKYTIITNNTISFNHPYGVYFYRSSGIIIYHNNFMNNTMNAYLGIRHCSNTWNNSNGEGNYWDDYTGDDNNGDGIGDELYFIGTGYNYDYYPLMFQYGEETGVKIVSPEEGFLYIRNLKIISLFTTLIFGKITIKVNAANYIHGIDRVEFYIDDKLHETDMIHPFNWTWKWTPKLILKHRHTVEVIAYDHAGNNVSKEMFVCRFF